MTEYAFLKEVAGIQKKKWLFYCIKDKNPRSYLMFYFSKEDQTEENVTSQSDLRLLNND